MGATSKRPYDGGGSNRQLARAVQFADARLGLAPAIELLLQCGPARRQAAPAIEERIVTICRIRPPC
jgi:hypothetical protein